METELLKIKILNIVDRCFHMYASDYRKEAKESASEMFDNEKLLNTSNKTKITRFEYITDKGREVVEYGEFTFQLQDDGRTLKVFKENKTK